MANPIQLRLELSKALIDQSREQKQSKKQDVSWYNF